MWIVYFYNKFQTKTHSMSFETQDQANGAADLLKTIGFTGVVVGYEREIDGAIGG